LAGGDEAAVEALDVFCGLLGSFVGDLVLLYGARGGVFLAGGILPQIRELLLQSRFAERFFNKGVMRPYLEQIPVRLMEHGQLGVIGAAGLYLEGQLPEGQPMEGQIAHDGRAERT
jgi:glucokinase